MTWKDFYADPDLADGFGSTAGNRLNAHFGLDFAHAAGTAIPSYVAGTVVTNQWSSALGWVLEVEAVGRFIGVRHMKTQSPLKVGTAVALGQTVGPVGNTGSASNGNHLCTTNASRKGGVFGTAYCSDPWPFIKAAISTSATAGGTATPTVQEDDMITRELVQSKAGNEGIFYSVNRIQRIHVPDQKTLKDYQFHLDSLAKAGDKGAVGTVQVVDNLNAFGVIVK